MRTSTSRHLNRMALLNDIKLASASCAGAFLIPYCIMVFLCGIPLQVLELAVGQYTREGPVDAMRDICPLLSGNVDVFFIYSTPSSALDDVDRCILTRGQPKWDNCLSNESQHYINC